VAPETRRYLAGLPFRIDLLPAGGHVAGPRVILVHGAPTLNTLYWTEDRSDEFCLRMATQAGAKAGDVLCFGHTHLPWHRAVDGIHFLNCGSVGRPKDGDWRAGYAVLQVAAASPGAAAPIVAEFRRVEYDLRRAMDAIVASDLPHEFAEHLRNGGASPVATSDRDRAP
jgi:diadenosine tetraphosphatase ApaH/serine/threonine PP2A family protein phosphatase